MDKTAHDRINILITDVGSYLGNRLTKHLLKNNYTVYGSGKLHPSEEVLNHNRFTLIELDLAQPLPAHLPNFDLIFHLTDLSQIHSALFSGLPAPTTNLINMGRDGKSRVFIITPARLSSQLINDFEDSNHNNGNVHLFLTGDLYGPQMPLTLERDKVANTHENELSNLITQAIKTDKVILEKEGTKIIYPTYIDDAINAILEFMTNQKSKKNRFIVSQEPLTALSAAYVIKSETRIVLDKELGLFFSGLQTEVKSQPDWIVRMSDMGSLPRVNLEEGLKATLESYELVNNLQKSDHLTDELKHEKNKASRSVLTDQKNHSKLQIPKLGSSKLKLLLIVLSILIVFLLKTVFDMAKANSNLINAQAALERGDFQITKEKSENASNNLKSAQNNINILSYPFRPVIKPWLENLNFAITSTTSAANALFYFASGAEVFSKNLQITTQPDNRDSPDSQAAQRSFSKASTELGRAQILAEASMDQFFLKKTLKTIATKSKNLEKVSKSLVEFSSIFAEITAAGSEKSYLIVLVDSRKIRPGGGTIGAIGKMNFAGGKLQDFAVQNSSEVDAKIVEIISPPKQLNEKLKVQKLTLSDALWSPDLELNAGVIEDMYKKSTGQNVDGIIQIDKELIKNFLELGGSVRLANTSITPQKLYDLDAASEKQLLDGFITGFINYITREESLIGAIKFSKDNFSQKHLLATIKTPSAATVIKAKNLNNQLPRSDFDLTAYQNQAQDIIALADANLSGSAFNPQRKISYKIFEDLEKKLTSELKITYTNTEDADYINFLKVYTPSGSVLEKVTNGRDTDLKKVIVEAQNNLSLFATYVEVPQKSTNVVTFTYKIASNLNIETSPSYNLLIQKQPGTNKDEFILNVDIPQNIYIKSEVTNKNAKEEYIKSVKTDLLTDRIFELTLSPK
jgi:nucleoside-diphosphate-sugar epimerase